MARRYAKARKVPGVKTALEQRYETEVLRPAMLAGQIVRYVYEGVKLRLADNTFYTPDFFVQAADGTLEAHEVKAFWEDDAKVKIKVAAYQYDMFLFKAAMPRTKKDGGGWSEQEF